MPHFPGQWVFNVRINPYNNMSFKAMEIKHMMKDRKKQNILLMNAEYEYDVNPDFEYSF